MAHSSLRSFSELVAWILLHFGDGLGAVHRNYQLFSAEQLQDRLRLGVIILQPLLDCFVWIV